MYPSYRDATLPKRNLPTHKKLKVEFSPFQSTSYYIRITYLKRLIKQHALFQGGRNINRIKKAALRGSFEFIHYSKNVLSFSTFDRNIDSLY